MTTPVDKRDIFLQGTSIFLRALTRTDAVDSDWYGWFNDSEVCAHLQKHYFPNTAEAQVAFLEQRIHGAEDKVQLGICKADSGVLIGIVSLNDIDYINRRAEFSIVIGPKDSRDLTTFAEACHLMFTHAFDTLNLNRLYGGSMSQELVQLMCRLLGCQQEGVARSDIYKNGSYRDAYRYGVLKHEYRRRD